MKVSAIHCYLGNNNFKSRLSNNCKKRYQDVPSVEQNSNVVNFRGTKGKVVGGLLGAGFAGLSTLAIMATPIGWLSTLALLASEAGGAVVGGTVGDKLEGKDND